MSLPLRARVALGLLIVLLLALPLVASNYIVSVVVLVLFAAYLGQAWNIMMGYVGLLSIGHALYVGLGAYTAAALFVHYGLPPWFGMIAPDVFCSPNCCTNSISMRPSAFTTTALTILAATRLVAMRTTLSR